MRPIRFSQLLSACLLMTITAITTLTITSLWTLNEETLPLPVLEESAIHQETKQDINIIIRKTKDDIRNKIRLEASKLENRSTAMSRKAEVGGTEKVKAEDMNIQDTHDGDKSAPEETMYDIQEHRQRLLYDACHKYEHIVNQSTRAWNEMYYDDQMDYIYCLISKASCTSWKRTLMMLSGRLPNFQRPEQLPVGLVHNYASSDKYVPRLEKLPEALRSSRFTNYFTFLFVREPLERLVSGYRDKLLVDPAYHVDVDIVRRYRPHEYNPSVKRYNVTFAEFVRYVLDHRASGHVLDRHWIPQYELCRVCLYRYDFIGHQETLHKDAAYVVSKLKSRILDPEQSRRVANITFPADSGHQKSSNFLHQMFSSVPAAHVRALFQMYAVDYALFGFEHPNVTGFT